MKHFIILSFLFFISSHVLHAQTDSTKYYLVLNGGKVIQANSIEVITLIFKGKFFEVNYKDRYEFADVIKYKDSTGEYVRDDNGEFLKKETRGKIKIVSRTRETYNSPHYMNGQWMGGGGFQKVTKYFLVDENGNTKNLNYKNLKPLVISDPETLKLVEKGRNLSIGKGSTYAAGLVMVIGGFIHTINRNSKTSLDDKVFISPFLIVGAVTVSVPAFLNPKKKYIKAVDFYNSKF